MILRQSTAKVISLGPFLDKTDGVTLETGLISAIDHATTGIKLSKNGGALTIRSQAVTASTYDAYGNYIVTLSTTDTNTVGTLRVQYVDAATCLPVWQDFQVVEEAVYDEVYGSGAAGFTTAIDSIVVATNAGDIASKTADAGTVTTGSNTSGSYTDTASDNDVYWITAPVSPAVGGFGLRQTLRFDLPLERVPTSLEIKGYWNGSGQTADVYALNSRTAVYDKLTNSGTNITSRNSEYTYSIPIPRDYADDTGGVNNIVSIEIRSASTNTGHRMRIDRALLYHVAETASFTLTAPTVNDIWTAPSRTLTTPGVEPVTVPTAAEVTAAVFARAFSASYASLTFEQLTSLMAAVLLGKVSGMGSNAPAFRDLADGADAVVAATDASGNRTSVTLTP